MSAPNLSLAPPVAATLANLRRQASGLVLICGSTGTGKTTTLSAMCASFVGVRTFAEPGEADYHSLAGAVMRARSLLSR